MAMLNNQRVASGNRNQSELGGRKPVDGCKILHQLMVNIPFIGFQPAKVLQDFVHPQ